MVDLDDDAAERLRSQAEQAGVTPAEFARRLLTEATDEDPFAFFNAGGSDHLRGDRADDSLAEHGFGRS